MTQNINVKKDAKVGLRKAMVPLGIIAAIFGLLFIVIHTLGVATTNADVQDKITKAARYIAMPTVILTLALTALMLTHGIMQLAKLNKTSVKWELVSGIINTIVGILMLVSFIVLIITVFDNNKWWAGSENVNIWKNCAFMGIITALSIYAACLGKNFNAKALEGKNTNIKMLRVIAISALVIAICNIVPTILTFIGGFAGKEKAQDVNSVASSEAAKFALGGLGTIALGILCMIPLAILGINDKAAAKKNIITWSVIGGIAFVLFVIPAAMMSLDHGYPKSWFDLEGAGESPKNVVITVFIMLSAIYSIVAASIACGKTKKFLAAKAA